MKEDLKFVGLMFLIVIAIALGVLTLFWGASSISKGQCNNGYIYIDDERGKGCVPWKE